MKIRITKSTYQCKNHHPNFIHYAEKGPDVDFIPVNIVKCDSCDNFSYFEINDPYYILITHHFYKNKLPASEYDELNEKYSFYRQKAFEIANGRNLQFMKDNKFVKKMNYYQNAIPIWINQNILKSKETISLFEETIDKCKNCNGKYRVSLFSCPICFERPDKSERLDFEILGPFELSPITHDNFTKFADAGWNDILFSRFTLDEFRNQEKKYISILKSEIRDTR